MPLPTGIWKMNLNGKELNFLIASIQGGIFSAQFLDQNQTGFWDEVSQTITFGVSDGQGGLAAVAAFKGYLFRSPEDPAPGRDVIATLAGSVQVSSVQVSTGPFAKANLISSSRRNVFGWFAQITEVV
jgi:hypothetical protein